MLLGSLPVKCRPMACTKYILLFVMPAGGVPEVLYLTAIPLYQEFLLVLVGIVKFPVEARL